MNVNPPEKFNFSKPETWPTWIRRFERYRQCSRLISTPQEQQVNTLVYCMGPSAEEILLSINLSNDDSNNYSKVKEALDAHFVVRKNVIFERARFNERKQEEGESVDSFITALYALAEHCNYQNLKEDLIRDRIVVGLRDRKLSERLQLDPNLTLEKATTQARQSETVRKQQRIMNAFDKMDIGLAGNVDAVHNKSYFKKSFNKYKNKGFKKQLDKKCTRCGAKPFHKFDDCPAKGNICQKCKIKGHMPEFCLTRKPKGKTRVRQIECDSEDSEDDSFLGTVDTEVTKDDEWNVKLRINKTMLTFKIDTGADTTCISHKIYEKHFRDKTLLPSDKKFKGPAKDRLKVFGKFKASLYHKNIVCKQNIYVIEHLHVPLLGLPAITQLGLVG